MSTIAEIEKAVQNLNLEEKGELLLRIAAQLRAQGAMPEPRTFTQEEMDRWVEEDEREGRRLRQELGI